MSVNCAGTRNTGPIEINYSFRDLKILYHHISLNFYRKRTCVKELLESFIIPNMQKIKMISAKKNDPHFALKNSGEQAHIQNVQLQAMQQTLDQLLQMVSDQRTEMQVLKSKIS